MKFTLVILPLIFVGLGCETKAPNLKSDESKETPPSAKKRSPLEENRAKIVNKVFSQPHIKTYKKVELGPKPQSHTSNLEESSEPSQKNQFLEKGNQTGVTSQGFIQPSLDASPNTRENLGPNSPGKVVSGFNHLKNAAYSLLDTYQIFKPQFQLYLDLSRDFDEKISYLNVNSADTASHGYVMGNDFILLHTSLSITP